MATSLPLAVRRLAALGILAGLAAGLVAAVAIPVQSAHVALDRSIADLEVRLERYALLAEEQPILEAQRAIMEERLPGEADLVGGGSDALAGASLQELATRIISDAGGLVERAQVLSVKTDGSLKPISLRMQFSGTIAALQRSLHALESGRPLLFIDAVDVHGKSGEVKKVRDDPSLNVMLQVTIDIHGYRREGGT